MVVGGGSVVWVICEATASDTVAATAGTVVEAGVSLVDPLVELGSEFGRASVVVEGTSAVVPVVVLLSWRRAMYTILLARMGFSE